LAFGGSFFLNKRREDESKRQIRNKEEMERRIRENRRGMNQAKSNYYMYR
jgi:hypothetical protein